MESQYIATCPREVQSLVASEIRSNGGVNVSEGFKSVYFDADDTNVYRMHSALRSASRIFLVVKKGSGSSLPIISNQSSKAKWDQFFLPNSTFLVEGVVGDRGPSAPSGTEVSKAVRQGLESYFLKKGLKKPSVDLKSPKIKIVAFVHNKRLTISIDTSGKAFHKRGYKVSSHPAPLKETLAASMLQLSGYTGSEPLYDPMSGSGTIPIEACYMALDKAPLIHRKKGEFALENLASFDYQLWRRVQDELRQSRRPSLDHPIHAHDISEAFIDGARQNAVKARVEKDIQFRVADFIGSIPPSEPGIIVTNLPYGERIQASRTEFDQSIKEFYKEFGNTLKRNYSGWRAAVLVSADSPYKFIGLRPSRKIPLMNGSIECKLLLFEMYQGSRKN
ncbi:MAG: class I SAM-dependent RNA methyltransferase [Pseudobacteriovorax sp.]|nr:class I SAM-dependent RNA methyltransferase [Pseudobacteriovorax sp.]